MGSHERRHRTRRWALVAAGTLLAGCSFGRRSLSVSRRQTILDSYGAGLAARNEASEAWAEGNGAWEGNFFRIAARRWARADDRFDTATSHFRRAESDCGAAGATAGAEVCSRARRYCGFMRDSAAAHATAAADYAAGRLDAGDRYLEAGFESYLDALDHEVPRVSTLEAALDERG